jgi:hypothetical protein
MLFPTAALLALAFVATPGAMAQSSGHVKAFSAASQQAKVVAADERFVNRLLRTEDEQIAKATNLLGARSFDQQKLSYLNSLTPTSPGQARLIALQIHNTASHLFHVQRTLNRSFNTLSADLTNLNPAIANALNKLQAFAPTSTQVMNYFNLTSGHLQTNTAGIMLILNQIPPSP